MRQLLLTLSLIFLTACGFVHDERIVGPYRLVAVDTERDLHVCYDLGHGDCLGRTPSTLTGYGFNDRWVTAAVQRNSGAPVEYYFIDRLADRRTLNAVDITQGPLSRQEFEARARELGLPSISRWLNG